MNEPVVVQTKRSWVVFSWVVPFFGVGVVAIFVCSAVAGQGLARIFSIGFGLVFSGVTALAFRGAFRISTETVADEDGLSRRTVLGTRRVAYSEVESAKEVPAKGGDGRELLLEVPGGVWIVSSSDMRYKEFVSTLRDKGVNILHEEEE